MKVLCVALFFLDCELVDTERYLGFSFVGVTGIFVFFFSFFKFLIFGLFSSRFFFLKTEIRGKFLRFERCSAV